MKGPGTQITPHFIDQNCFLDGTKDCLSIKGKVRLASLDFQATHLKHHFRFGYNDDHGIKVTQFHT